MAGGKSKKSASHDLVLLPISSITFQLTALQMTASLEMIRYLKSRFCLSSSLCETANFPTVFVNKTAGWIPCTIDTSLWEAFAFRIRPFKAFWGQLQA